VFLFISFDKNGYFGQTSVGRIYAPCEVRSCGIVYI